MRDAERNSAGECPRSNCFKKRDSTAGGFPSAGDCRKKLVPLGRAVSFRARRAICEAVSLKGLTTSPPTAGASPQQTVSLGRASCHEFVADSCFQRLEERPLSISFLAFKVIIRLVSLSYDRYNYCYCSDRFLLSLQAPGLPKLSNFLKFIKQIFTKILYIFKLSKNFVS